MSIRGPDGKLVVAPTAPSAVDDHKCRPAAEWKAGEVIHADVVVVGTGAGGAIAGNEFAKAGKKVLFLEAGGAYSTKDFKKRNFPWSTTHLYSRKGLQFGVGQPPILIPSGRCVGGSTVLNSGICFRPPQERLQEWAKFVGDDALLPEAMRPFVDEVWKKIGVVPTHLGIGRRHNAVLQQGLINIGAQHDFIDRNAPACVGCGVCHYGCPSGGKASVDKAILPEALNHDAEIRYRARVDGIIVEGGRATGVQVAVVDPHSERVVRQAKVRADLVIVAGSAFGTPILLERSGAASEGSGKHLSIHPASAAVAEFEEPVQMWNGVPQGYWGRVPGDDRFVIESANVGAAELFGLFGRAGKKGAEIAKRFPYWAMGGAMVRDEGEGTVELAEEKDGPRPAVAYNVTDRDVAALKDGLKAVTRAYFAAGAKKVCPLVNPAVFYEREADALEAVDRVSRGTDFAHVHASHPHGSCRLSPNAQTGGVDKDGKVHGVEALYVADGSLFPSTLGVNPQVTIMSLAMMLSRRLLA